VEGIAFAPVLVRRLDHDATSRDAVEEVVELRGFGTDSRFELVGARDVAERDLEWQLHGLSFARSFPRKKAATFAS
jgi:hypothetical protein